MSKRIEASDRLFEREMLYEKLPLEAPFTIQIYVSDVCNFRCKYCVQSMNQKARDQYISFQLMDLSTYKQIIDNIKELGRLKKLLLFGTGEPLCHPDFAEIVRYAKEKDVSDVVETFSNGALLTHDLSQRLIDNGLDNLKISLQGLSAEDYRNVAGIDIDFEKFLHEIEYFYNHRRNCRLQLKIIDSMLPTEVERKRFYELYEPICDDLIVESLMDLDWGQEAVHANKADRAVYGNESTCAKICSRPFFNLHIKTDGTVRPCCFAPLNFSLGNAKEGLKDIWLGPEYNRFLCSLLSGDEKTEFCKRCKDYLYLMMSSDILDGHETELLERYQKIGISRICEEKYP